MSMSFVLCDHLELYVDNPGYGEIVLSEMSSDAPDHEGNRPIWRDRWLLGSSLGTFLAQMTAYALTGRAPTTGSLLPARLTSEQARAALPAVQEAVVLAAAGTDHYERTFPDPDDLAPRPICVRCKEGTPFYPGAMPSSWCDQHGHTAYGYGAETSWANAQLRNSYQRRDYDQAEAVLADIDRARAARNAATAHEQL